MGKDKIVGSPKGKLMWGHLRKPNTKFDEVGYYQCDLVVPKAEAAEFCAAIDAALEESAAEAAASKKGKTKKAAPPYKIEGDEVTFKFKQKAKRVMEDGTEIDFMPKLTDANKKDIPADVIVGNGSIVKVGYSFYKWQSPALGAGVTLQPRAVKVFDLVEYVAEDWDTEDEEQPKSAPAAGKRDDGEF